jgi:hypothetical protein
MSNKAPPSAMANSDARAQINPVSGEPQELSGTGLVRPIEAYEEKESDYPEKLSVGSEKS